MLILAVMPITSLYKLLLGQYGYTGHVVNLPQDVASFSQSLPRLHWDLGVFVVRREGANQMHHDLRVRRTLVLRALQWLVTHNQSLGVTIDTSALDQLPQDGNTSGLVSVTQYISSYSSTTTIQGMQQKIYCMMRICHSHVPIAAPSMTEQEAVQQSVEQFQAGSFHTPLMWPSIGGMLLNEFTTESYFLCLPHPLPYWSSWLPGPTLDTSDHRELL